MRKHMYEYLKQNETNGNDSGFNVLKLATFITLILVASIISFVVYFL
jgi:hypothetical protein